MSLVHLTVVPNESEAEILCALLRTEGIECDHDLQNHNGRTLSQAKPA